MGWGLYHVVVDEGGAQRLLRLHCSGTAGGGRRAAGRLEQGAVCAARLRLLRSGVRAV
jgi:hypothetical protein